MAEYTKSGLFLSSQYHCLIKKLPKVIIFQSVNTLFSDLIIIMSNYMRNVPAWLYLNHIFLILIHTHSGIDLLIDF